MAKTMILRDIFIEPDRYEYSKDYAFSFSLKTRHILNYVERNCLKKIKFRSEGFNRIVFTLTEKDIKEKFYVNSQNVLVVYHFFNKKEYENIPLEKLSEYLINLVLELFSIDGLNNLLPIEEIKETLVKFKDNNYKNTWLYKKKLNRTLKLNFFLECELTIEEFILDLRVGNKKGELIYERELLRWTPGEIGFSYQFKDIDFREEEVVITSRSSKPLAVIPYNEIRKE